MTVVGLILIGFLAGAEAAILGVGGGIIYVPALSTLFDFAQKKAQGTSLAVIMPAALVAALTHTRAGRVEWRIAVKVAAGGIVGAGGGALLAQLLDDQLLRRLFAVMLVIVAARMLMGTLRSTADRHADLSGP